VIEEITEWLLEVERKFDLPVCSRIVFLVYSDRLKTIKMFSVEVSYEKTIRNYLRMGQKKDLYQVEKFSKELMEQGNTSSR
jgi:hypothetical protein